MYHPLNDLGEILQKERPAIYWWWRSVTYPSQPTAVSILSISQSVDEIRSEIETERSVWRGMKSMTDMQRKRIHNECTVSLALREIYIILVNSTHRLEFWDFSLTLSFIHYQWLQFLVARKLLPILVDDHKITGKFRLEGTLGGL